MFEFQSMLAVIVIGGFVLVIVFIMINICRAALGAREFERQAAELVRAGKCPCCGETLEESTGTNCRYCGNWIEGHRRAAFRD